VSDGGTRQGGKPSTIEFYGVNDVYSESGIDLTLLRSRAHRVPAQSEEKRRTGRWLTGASSSTGCRTGCGLSLPDLE
jgi:hypothetical protein